MEIFANLCKGDQSRSMCFPELLNYEGNSSRVRDGRRINNKLPDAMQVIIVSSGSTGILLGVMQANPLSPIAQ